MRQFDHGLFCPRSDRAVDMNFKIKIASSVQI